MRKPRRNWTRTRPSDMPRYCEIIQYLLKEGKSMSRIASLLNKDHTTIMYMVNKYGLKAPKYDHNGYKKRQENKEIKGERINRGKDYKEYLAEQKDRKYNKLIGLTR